MKDPKRVVAAVIERDGTVLLAQRKRGSRFELKWEFPGGTVEAKEHPKETLRRELFEELNIQAEIGDFFCENTFDYGEFVVVLTAFKVASFSGAIKLNDHERIAWVAVDDLATYDISGADGAIVQKLVDSHRDGDVI
ncbi:MAG: (deoxy)nucleoside triphosphate pyrophosphohydrolase [Deltaproteobacteria bacterium]|nr:(deoxy)nucleoside triphosphate pyrophosphohydrolase [Deltaproteobacteria bacterium]